MFKRLFCSIAVACGATTLHSLNTNMVVTDIVVFDASKALSQSLHGQALQNFMNTEGTMASAPLEKEQNELKEMEAKLVEMNKALEKQYNEYQTKAPLLSTEARAKEEKEITEKAQEFESLKRVFENKANALQMKVNQVQQKMSELYKSELTKIEKIIKTIIERLSAEKSWKIVLLQEQIVFAITDVNVTDIIIIEMDKIFKAELNQTIKKDSQPAAKKATASK